MAGLTRLAAYGAPAANFTGGTRVTVTVASGKFLYTGQAVNEYANHPVTKTTFPFTEQALSWYLARFVAKTRFPFTAHKASTRNRGTMNTHHITPTRVRQLHRRLMYKDGAETVEFNYAPWTEDNGQPVTSVTVTVESGDAAISNEFLANNVHSMLVTTNNVGWNLLKLVATDGTNENVQYLEIAVKDPQRRAHDYGICD